MPNRERKKEVMDMLYKYKEAFTLRDEIDICPTRSRDQHNGQIPILYQAIPYKDKTLIDKEMKHLCYLGVLKEGFLAYFSPVMLISRKLTPEKRVVTDIRHLNMRIAPKNWHIPCLQPCRVQGRAGMRRRRPSPSIKLLLNHQSCCRTFIEQQK